MSKNNQLHFEIINMDQSHIHQIAAIEADAFSAPWSEKAFADTLAMENVLFQVAFVKGQVAGYCGIYLAADEGEITNVAVAVPYRRNKIAETLLQATLAKASQKGAVRIFLEVRESNIPAIQLYQKAGFIIVGYREHFYQCPIENALVMKYEFADK